MLDVVSENGRIGTIAYLDARLAVHLDRGHQRVSCG